MQNHHMIFYALFICVQFLDPSKTPYQIVPDNAHVEEADVNPSASLNEWLVPPSSQENEVCFSVANLFLLLH